jgi:pimeloyl-ACP methyl ester carboxylesterase
LIAPDLPGHGHTPASILSDPTVSAFARLINDLCKELSPPAGAVETVLVGHSMGCRIVLEAFSQQPSNATGIILLDGSWYGPAPTRDYKPTTSSPAEELRVVMDVFDSMMGPETPEAFKDQVRRHLGEVDLAYVGRLRRDYIRWDGERMEDVFEVVKSSGVGVLVVQGTEGHGRERRALKEDEEGPWMRFVRERVAEGRYTGCVVERSGHWVHVDGMTAVAEVIKRFGRGVEV